MVTGEVLAELEDPDRAGLVDLEFTADGNTLVALTSDREFLLWHLDRIRAGLADLGLDWGD